jgi:hypothetical protein
MRFLVFLAAFLLTAPVLRGEEMKAIAVGKWSEWDNGLRGRLLLFKGRSMLTPDHRETLVFVELENQVAESESLIDVYFDPENLKCRLDNHKGDAVPPRTMTVSQREFFEHRRPARCWVTLPDASSLRLRVNPYCAGEVEDIGLLIPFHEAAWMIEAGDTGDYFLSGVLTVRPPKDHGRANAWQGKLELPRMRIALGKP